MSTVIDQIILSGSPDFNISTIADTYAYWRADKPTTLTIDGSNKVVAWRNSLGDATKEWTQPTSGSAPIYNPSKAVTGKPALDFVKAAQLYMQNTMTRTASDMSIWFMVDRVNSAGSTEDIFSTETGPLTLASIAGTTGYTGYYDTSWKQAVNSVTGTSALGFQYTGTGATAGTMYRGFTSLGNFTYSTARAFGGTSGLGAYFDGSAQWFDGCMYEVIVFNSALTFAQRTTLLDYWAKKYRFDPNA